MKALRFFALITIVGLLAGYASTRFVSTWKEPTAGAGSLDGQKIATFVASPESATRRPAEDLLAAEISARGAEGVQLTTELSQAADALGPQRVVQSAERREAWFQGEVSARCRQELEDRGWKVHAGVKAPK